MITVTDFIQVTTIEKFAETHGLTMEILERPYPIGDPARFYASFLRAEVKGDGVLIGTFGNGSTPEEAIKNYAREISMETLVFVYPPPRVEIKVPRLEVEQ